MWANVQTCVYVTLEFMRFFMVLHWIISRFFFVRQKFNTNKKRKTTAKSKISVWIVFVARKLCNYNYSKVLWKFVYSTSIHRMRWLLNGNFLPKNCLLSPMVNGLSWCLSPFAFWLWYNEKYVLKRYSVCVCVVSCRRSSSVALWITSTVQKTSDTAVIWIYFAQLMRIWSSKRHCAYFSNALSSQNTQAPIWSKLSLCKCM